MGAHLREFDSQAIRIKGGVSNKASEIRSKAWGKIQKFHNRPKGNARNQPSSTFLSICAGLDNVAKSVLVATPFKID